MIRAVQECFKVTPGGPEVASECCFGISSRYLRVHLPFIQEVWALWFPLLCSANYVLYRPVCSANSETCIKRTPSGNAVVSG